MGDTGKYRIRLGTRAPKNGMGGGWAGEERVQGVSVEKILGAR